MSGPTLRTQSMLSAADIVWLLYARACCVCTNMDECSTPCSAICECHWSKVCTKGFFALWLLPISEYCECAYIVEFNSIHLFDVDTAKSLWTDQMHFRRTANLQFNLAWLNESLRFFCSWRVLSSTNQVFWLPYAIHKHAPSFDTHVHALLTCLFIWPCLIR